MKKNYEEKIHWATKLFYDLFKDISVVKRYSIDELDLIINKNDNIEKCFKNILSDLGEYSHIKQKVIKDIYMHNFSKEKIAKKENLTIDEVNQFHENAIWSMKNFGNSISLMRKFNFVDPNKFDMYEIENELASKIKCSACGKSFDMFDYQEDFTFDRYIGYGSNHDEEHIRFRLCCDCFDKIFDALKPTVKDINIEEYDAFAGCERHKFTREDYEEIFKDAEDIVKNNKNKYKNI